MCSLTICTSASVGEHQRQLLLEHEHAGGNRRDDVVAVIDERLELRDVEVLVLLHRLEIAELELGHAAALFLAHHLHRNAVVLEHDGQVFGHVRLVAVAVTGDEQRDLAARFVGRRDLRGLAGLAARPLRAGVRMKLRDRRRGVDAERGLQQLAARLGAVHRVDDLGNHGNAGDAAEPARVRQQFVAERVLALAMLHVLGAQHQVREVDVPGMRRHVRTLRHEAHVTQVTVIDDLPVDLLVDAVELERGRLASIASKSVGNELHRLKQRRQPWQMSKTRSSSFSSAASSTNSALRQSSG